MPLINLRNWRDWKLTKLLMKTQLFWIGDYFKEEKK